MKAVNKRTMKCCRSQCQNAMFSSSRRTRLPGTVPQVESQGCQDDTLPKALPESMRALHQPEAEAGCPKQGLRPQPHPGLQDQVKHGLDCYYDVPEATGCFTSWNGLHSTAMPRVSSTGQWTAYRSFGVISRGSRTDLAGLDYEGLYQQQPEDFKAEGAWEQEGIDERVSHGTAEWHSWCLASSASCAMAEVGFRRSFQGCSTAGANAHEKLPRFLDGTSKLRHCHVRFSAPKLARLIVNN